MVRLMRTSRKAQDMNMVLKVAFIILLLLALLFAAWKIISWLRGSGEEQVTNVFTFGG
ncbi:MAG: hypothetical protein ACE5DM_00850 [Candidatus Nanoarchaeia archaeon]